MFPCAIVATLRRRSNPDASHIRRSGYKCWQRFFPFLNVGIFGYRDNTIQSLQGMSDLGKVSAQALLLHCDAGADAVSALCVTNWWLLWVDLAVCCCACLLLLPVHGKCLWTAEKNALMLRNRRSYHVVGQAFYASFSVGDQAALMHMY